MATQHEKRLKLAARKHIYFLTSVMNGVYFNVVSYLNYYETRILYMSYAGP